MRISLIVFQILLLAGFSFANVASQITFKIDKNGDKISAESIGKGSSALVSVSSFLEKLKYSCKWDRYLQKLTCTKDGSTIIFIQDNPFFCVNSTVNQLPVAPSRRGLELFLPASVLIKSVEPLHKGISLHDESVSKPNTGSSKYSIRSIVCEKKQNGTLVTLTLSDSLRFESTYFYPNLSINFLDGTVDTHDVRRKVKTGIVDSIFSLQYKKSAQVSLILTREIEEPLIDYIQDTRTLMIALKPKKVKAPPPKKIENVNYISLNSSDSESLTTLVLDPGHGGKDPGAIGASGTLEKDVALAITLKVRDLLKKQKRIKTYLTRDKDVFVPLADRTKFANEKKAELFISVHADAVPGNSKRKEKTRGYKIYFLSQAKNDEDKLVAMRENAVIELEEKPQNYSNLQNVLIDLAGNEFLKESQDLCISLDQKFETNLNKKISKLHLGVGQANFWVLNGAYMPSVLVEAGFLSNPEEEKLLSDKEFQKKIALAIYEAIVNFKSSYETGL